MNADQADAWQADLSLFYRCRTLSLTAGASFYSINYQADDAVRKTRINYAAFRLTPLLSLPWRFRAEGQFVFFTSQAPIRTDNGNTCAYGELRLSKEIGSHLLFSAEWHDMFQSCRSAALGTVSYRF